MLTRKGRIDATSPVTHAELSRLTTQIEFLSVGIVTLGVVNGLVKICSYYDSGTFKWLENMRKSINSLR